MADIRAAITKAILAGKPGGPHPGGIAVYHSSPHDFDKFDWSKLRTGEGANSYGAGFYFAENPAVSGQGGQYWNNFLGRFQGPEQVAAKYLGYAKYDREAARQALADAMKADAAEYAASATGKRLQQQDAAALRLLESAQHIGPRTYEVNIAARPELMLDWNKPLTAQSPLIQDYLTKGPLRGESLPTDTGQRSYQRLTGHDPEMKTYASEELRAAGIPGIRYLDEGSRPMPAPELANLQWRLKQAQEAQQKYPQMQWSSDDVARYQKQIAEEQAKAANPTYNYVVTDPSKLAILAKYGVAGGAAVPVMSGAFDQSRYEAQQ